MTITPSIKVSEIISDDMLKQILFLLPEERATIPLVCTRWNTLMREINEFYAWQYSQIPIIRQFMPNDPGLTDFQRLNTTINRIERHFHITLQHGLIEPQSLESAIRQADTINAISLKI